MKEKKGGLLKDEGGCWREGEERVRDEWPVVGNGERERGEIGRVASCGKDRERRDREGGELWEREGETVKMPRDNGRVLVWRSEYILYAGRQCKFDWLNQRAG